MKPKKLNPKLLWMQFEDVLAPRLGLSIKERAVYSYLLRHSLGAARQACAGSMSWGLCACSNAA